MKAFIFDFDGVIVDSEKYWASIADTTFFPQLIKGWKKEDGAKMMGLGLEAGHAYLVKNHGLTLSFLSYKESLHKSVATIYTELTQLLPGLRELIERLHALGIPLAIASSNEKVWIEPTLNRFHLDRYFKVICSGNDVGIRTKPLPDVYLLAAEKLGVDPAECLVLEDSTNGIKAAKAAGMTCIAIKTDMSALQDLSQADMIVEHYDEITDEYLQNP